MYPATAGVGSSLQSLERFPDYQQEQLLILAGLELTIAYRLLEARWKIANSIFWKRSNAATKHSVRAKLDGIAFDANSSIIKAGKLLNRYYDLHGIDERDREAWSQVIRSLTNGHRWLNEEFGIDCTAKQLKIDL
ncbi:hypothetical protein [Chamaesiphon sp. OTE_75_metabat_556]|uniref:hypothetical protein n=1 Tax=Chamaesiphon sp. OTE_75_metabat_556 TaxID=2964692 RepID=UPI002869FC4B|nr:hypothetical protein [Chamaesiphon sp. OTE_75_metabat_556]